MLGGALGFMTATLFEMLLEKPQLRCEEDADLIKAKQCGNHHDQPENGYHLQHSYSTPNADFEGTERRVDAAGDNCGRCKFSTKDPMVPLTSNEVFGALFLVNHRHRPMVVTYSIVLAKAATHFF